MIPPRGGVFFGATNGSSLLSTSNCGSGSDLAPEATYQWTPRMSGQAVITTCGSTFDTILYVCEGSCLGSEIACNDDNCSVHSIVAPLVSAGTTYFIVVDGFGGATGSYTLTVRPPSPSGAFLDGAD